MCVSAQIIGQKLIKISHQECLSNALTRIRAQSRVKVPIGLRFCPVICSAPFSAVRMWAEMMSLGDSPGLNSQFDLNSGHYEGGFKIWESTRDLIEFLVNDNQYMPNIMYSKRRVLRFLELGTGSSLPTIALINRLINDDQFKSNYRVHIHDYNWSVLVCFSTLNFALNLEMNYLKEIIRNRCLRLYHGDWSQFKNKSNYKYDLIYMSEVLYNVDSYEALHNLLDKRLRRKGYIVIATKNTYFGLTGGIAEWQQHILDKDIFEISRIIPIKNNNIPRSILIMQRKVDTKSMMSRLN